MKTKLYTYPLHHAFVETSFLGAPDGAAEIHACIHITDTMLSYGRQLEALLAATDTFLKEPEMAATSILLKRYFLSDAANQADALLAKEREKPFALSVVQQRPLDGSKIAVWIYLQRGALNDSYTHHWWANQYVSEGSSEQQMDSLFRTYQHTLQQQDMDVVRNCVRTWLFVQNIDVNYAGVVKARNDCFNEWGLTDRTHYITSTGIQGRQASGDVCVSMDAYAVGGLKPEQIKYLYAPTHLSPTHIYGVAFERGVCVEYGDRKQLYISGTASIDQEGKVVHVGDVAKQVLRMCENVEKLLEEGGAALQDIAQALVYLRDPSDYPVVEALIKIKLPHTPVQFLYAPVCRPTWLVEMECIAVVSHHNPCLPSFFR